MWKKRKKEIIFLKNHGANVSDNLLEVEPQEAIFIGDDFKCDIIGARKVGIEGVLISQLENSESNPKKVFRHISQEILEKNKLKL